MKFEFNFLSVMMRVEAVTMTFKYSRWDSEQGWSFVPYLCQDVEWIRNIIS